MHRQMTRLAAKCRRIHIVHRALAGEQDEDDVDGGQRDDGQYRSARRRLAEIEDRPVACSLGMMLESPGFQPHPERNEQEAEHEQSGDKDEDDQARVRVIEESSGDGNEQRDEDDGAHRRQHGAGHGQRMARQSRAASQVTCYLRLCM